MTLNRFLSILTLLGVFSTFAQTSMIPFQPVKSKLWGFMDIQGKVLIEPKFNRVEDFTSEGLALVVDAGGKFQFIDKNGNPLKIGFDKFTMPSLFGFNMKGFNNGMANIVVNKKYASIDVTGKTVHDAIYDKISDYENGFAVGNIGNTYFLLFADGKKLDISESMLEVRNFSEGLAPYRAMNEQFGFINSKGEIVIKAQFNSVGYFSEGLAWAKTSSNKIGFIDTKGTWVIQPTYDMAKEFDKETGLALVKTGATFAFINKSGQTITASGAISYGEFNEGLAYAKTADKVGFINKNGEWVVLPKYDKVERFVNGFANVKTVEFWGAVDKKGNIVIEPKYQGINEVNEGIFAVKAGALWGFVTSDGKTLVEPKFNAIRDFKNGYAAVKIGDLWGLIDKSGKMVIEPQFQRVLDVMLVK